MAPESTLQRLTALETKVDTLESEVDRLRTKVHAQSNTLQVVTGRVELAGDDSRNRASLWCAAIAAVAAIVAAVVAAR